VGGIVGTLKKSYLPGFKNTENETSTLFANNVGRTVNVDGSRVY